MPSSQPSAGPDRLSLCHTHPEKLRARWDRTSGVRSSTRCWPGLREGPRPQHHIWLWEEERGPREGAATWKRDTHHSYPWDLSPCKGPWSDHWMTKLPHLLFPGTVLPGFLIIPSVAPTAPASCVPQEEAQSPAHPNAPVPLTRPVGAKQMPWTKVYGPMTFIKPTQDKTTGSFPTATRDDNNFKCVYMCAGQ